MDHNRGRATSLSAVGEVVPREVEVHCTAREVEVHCNETFGPVQASIPDRTQLGPDGMSEVDKAKARKIVEAALQQYIMQEALNYDSDSDSEPPSPALNPIAASPESPRSEQNFSPASPLSPPSPTPGTLYQAYIVPLTSSCVHRMLPRHRQLLAPRRVAANAKLGGTKGIGIDSCSSRACSCY